jgi:hypothetical protein
VSLPGLSPSSGGLVVAVSLAQATGFLAGCCEATGFAVLKDILLAVPALPPNLGWMCFLLTL